MSNILVINSGSTSIKYKVFDQNEKQLLAGNLNDFNNHENALKQILRKIVNIGEIKAVGHRMVHGGDKFFRSLLINDENISELEKFNDLAPLHNPYNLAGIKASLNFLPHLPQVAVFDTAFYFNLPEIARTYALPKELLKQHKIRRYGFHGISHEYVMSEAAQKLKKPAGKINLITCHLGGGWSITAIKNGRPIDTSMGFTPMEGLVMMTRSGDIDPGLIFYLLHNEAVREEERITSVYHMLNYESGIKGLSGVKDYQELIRNVSLGNSDCQLAFDIAINRLVKYIGSYWAILEGKVDAIVFTGGIGAGNAMTRNEVKNKIKFLGEVKILSIQTNEELMIAREVRKLVSGI
ncbi:acetate kinase [Candidatus Falkowbacteria bacterium CG_4_9_14_3_um_filter_36_9]|uniref:Acetate kinase n=2 Tax=Patescibacteria group TaxID=1783273 RepID=A0A2M7DQP9_9BACT|nr:MAG: acetate kinase [Candidatus Falkowbacteria bacterium CG02_land_8_20_14_3_00_36_14]PIX11165.1 MAG: acetate kinase [Candidatus Falkowbacteria bacterium CG_4_8_14_3_um_filter_36_11]PIX67817.1 MAG: acetate kinase [Candidatus Shapirobacteria bacterium CG_4_10_14_3_um_filter_35_13]PJA10255.1 MAG: acetate kinase [Candidatus Falkowbacteria bacterium CG_4_10_14_0_2_um_filter_36_22]PJB18831.1 MAG: acetate kinase [Candidatus Falkowbacteria bacterium CG_4_9_14_3_um_filter_36_9]